MKKNSTLLYVTEGISTNNELPQVYALHDLSIRSNVTLLRELESYRTEPSKELTERVKAFARSI